MFLSQQCFAAAILFAAFPAPAQERATEPARNSEPRVAIADTAPAVDKSEFNLFRPTPRSAMRPLTTDRPDTTESPITVDAGHVQIESSLVEYSRRREGSVRTRTIDILPSNVKLGLLDNVDIQFVFTPHTRVTTQTNDEKERVTGFGDDSLVRLKINLWGNDGPDPKFGDTSFGVMPFIKFPTGPKRLSNGRVEGGLILPLAISLPRDFTLGVMAEFDVVYDEDRRKYGVDFVHSATLGHALVGKLNGYVEYVGIAPRVGKYQPFASTGLSYLLGDDCSVDIGVRLLLARDRHDFTAFTGFSLRF